VDVENHAPSPQPLELLSPVPDSPPQPLKRSRGKLPAKFRDFVPSDCRSHRDALPQLLVPTSAAIHSLAEESAAPTSFQGIEAATFHTPDNAFGMFRKYQTLPMHNPESIVSMESLSNVKPTLPLEQASAALYALYPNYNAFKLGQWYWADGLNDWDSDDRWEDADAGWRISSITIEVPFHRNSLHPGAHKDLQASPPEPSCTLPHYVVALMFWSDGTHLTDFRTASLTPLYMQYGNESKYRGCKPTMHLTDHVAYFEELPDKFKVWSSQYLGKNKTNSEFLSHCRWELAHAQWQLLLDDDFINAYQHGLVVQWEDGISRRFYPRIFCYSADYKEKALMATVRMNGLVPCLRCKVLKVAAHLIYKENHKVDSAHVKRLLMPESLVPTMIELGVWKHLFIHLLRMLESLEAPQMHELDHWFCLVPTFGRDTIRRFARNVSELKKMAARDYEDLLQTAIPVFEGLLNDLHDAAIANLLFQFAHWHGLAKLRLHSDFSVAILDEETTCLGNSLREFQKTTCPSFDTRELPKEEARERKAMVQTKSRPAKSVTKPSESKKAKEKAIPPESVGLVDAGAKSAMSQDGGLSKSVVKPHQSKPALG
ncbi:hypothetical protein DXG01_008139, partial [Tephrocybe rancida]